MLRAMRPGALQDVPALPRIALFSDVDGTLLSSTDRLAITPGDVSRIAPRAELILASSRTLVELADVQRRLGIAGALIAENGAVVSFPPGWRGSMSNRLEVQLFGDAWELIWRRVQRCAERAEVHVIRQRDLVPDFAVTVQRSHSVCVRNWAGEDADRFLAELRRDRLTASRSGTWITVTSRADKGTGVRAVLKHARKLRAPFKSSVSIGNEANDKELLESTDVRFAIRNPRRGHHEDLIALPDVTPLGSSGAKAWRVALARILENGQR
jgi:predicted mannosyl-3-phosphoglycerate phosphatase (HAD superfamily)